jgi:hypothetical protein
LPGVYGIELDGDGAPGTLAAFALAPHRRGNDLIFSAVPLYDPGTIHSSDVVFAGIPIGAQETLPTGVYIPRLSLANFSDSPLTFSVYLADTRTTPAKDASGNTQPPQLDMIHAVTIPPHQTREYEFSGQESQSGLLHSVIVTTKGTPGTYQAKLVSRSTGTLYQVELLAKETLEMNNAGVHPWTLQGDTESHIVLFNHSKSDKKVGIFINAAGSTLWASETVLAASETREVSINKLQRDQIADDQGRRLPITAKEGVVDWMSPESGDVTGRLMVTSRSAAMARNFSCGTYKSECSLEFSTYFSDITVGSPLQMYGAAAEICINSQPLQCSNASSTNGTVNYSWNVGAASIIKLNASTEQTKPSPMLLGVSGGTGTATVVASAGACQSTGSAPPAVQVPTALKVVQTTTNGANTCGAGQNGWIRVVERGVIDQNGAAIVLANQTIGETVTVNPAQNGLFITSVATHPGITDVDGEYPDTFSFCSTACPGSATTSLTQTNDDTLPSGGKYPLTNSNIQWACSNIKINGALTP